MVDELTKAWAAGLFDGEGSGVIEKRLNNHYQIFVSVCNTDARVLEPFIENWRAVYHGRNDIVWFGRDEAIHFLRDILPYLKSKQDQMLVVLEALLAHKKEVEEAGVRGASRVIEPYYHTLREIFTPTKGKHQ